MRFDYRYASNPAHQTSRLMRVRIYTEDPLTGEPTGRTLTDIRERLASCSRIENYSLTTVTEGVYDEMDEESYLHTPGRLPSCVNRDEDLPIDCLDCPPFFEVRLVIAERSKAPTASFIARLLDVKVREVVMCDRTRIRGVSFGDIAQAWIDAYNDDNDEVEFRMDPDAYRAFYRVLDEVDAAESNVDTLKNARLIAEKAPWQATWPVEDSCVRITQHGVTTIGDEMAPLAFHNPYEFTAPYLAGLANLPIDHHLNPKRLDMYPFMDRYSVEGDGDDATIACNLMEDVQNGMGGLIRRSCDKPDTYAFTTFDNGLCYERIGAYARILSIGNISDESNAILDAAPSLDKLICLAYDHMRTLTLPWHVFRCAFAWAFIDADDDAMIGYYPSFVPLDAPNEYEKAGAYALKWIDAHMRILGIETIDEYLDEMFAADVELSVHGMPAPKLLNEPWRHNMRDIYEDFRAGAEPAANHIVHQTPYPTILLMWDVERDHMLAGEIEHVGDYTAALDDAYDREQRRRAKKRPRKKR